MANNIPFRKTLERLLKKVEELENQSFAQKLHIDELENKLARTEETLKQVQENPFGNITTVPSVWPAATHNSHACTPGLTTTGGTFCAICGAQMSDPSWTITCTAGSISMLADPSVQSSTDVEPLLDLDISWEVPDDFPLKKD